PNNRRGPKCRPLGTATATAAEEEPVSDSIPVIDRTDENRFVYREDGHEAELTYRVEGDRLILDHTGVPDELGGRGVGGKLVAAAVERAAASGEAIAPWCPFTRSWLERHPDEAATIT